MKLPPEPTFLSVTAAGDYHFNNVVVLRPQREVQVDGRAVALGDRAFDLLVHLIERRDRVVGKDELLAALWPSQVVEDGNLHVHVSALRRALGAAVISTAHGRGYRFAALLRETRQLPRPTAAPAAGAALIGREALLATLRPLLKAQRLLTLAGPGGVGKTRLAHELVAGVDRVCWVDLGSAGGAEPMRAAIASVLGLGPAADAETLARQARAVDGLLVLDNAEHLLADVALVVQALLVHDDGPRLLVTTRQALGLRAEHVVTVPGLALPAGDETTACASVQLLELRAAAADPRFELTERLQPLASALCRRLDGLPLALELAAARVPLLGLAGVLEGLDVGPGVLTTAAPMPHRHHSLQSVLEWSYALLSADEQAALRRLSLLAGAFTLEQAAAVVGRERWSFVETLEALLRKSLVAADPERAQCWRLLQTTRDFAATRLERAGESASAWQRLAQAMAEQFEALSDDWVNGRRPEDAIEQAAGQALPHLCAALAWACAPGVDAERALLSARLLAAGARTLFVNNLGRQAEPWADATFEHGLLDWPEALVARLRMGWNYIIPAALRPASAMRASLATAVDLLQRQGDGARLEQACGWLAQEAGRAGDGPDAAHWLELGRQIEQPLGRPRMRAWRLHAQTEIAWLRGIGVGPAAHEIAEVLDDLEAAGDGDCRMARLLRRGEAERRLLAGDPRSARDLIRELVARSEAKRNRVAECPPYDALALAELACGDIDAARAPLQKALAVLRRTGSWPEVTATLAWYLALQGRSRAAVELVAAARATADDEMALVRFAHDAALRVAAAACSAEDLQRWQASGTAFGPTALPQLLYEAHPRFMP